MISIHKIAKRTSQRGYGLVLMMLFVATTVMVMLSLQMTTQTSVGQVMKIALNNVTAESMAKTGLMQARTQILTDLDAETLNPLLDSGAGSPATWTYTSTVSVPSDPSNLGSAPVSVGSFTATITQWRAGGWYVVKSVGTANGASVTFSDLMEIQPSYTCSVQGAATENAILAGNITTLSDDDLIKYAQHDCMRKTSPAGIAAYSVTAGTGTSCSSSTHPPTADTGSGTLNLGDTTGTCERDILGTYSLVYLGSLSSSYWVDIHNTSGGLTEVHATNLSGANRGIDGYNLTTDSNSPLLLKLNSITNGAQVHASTVNDTISLTGNMTNGKINGKAGNDTVIIGGNLSGTPGALLGADKDTIYVNYLKPGGVINGENDDDQIFFDQTDNGNNTAQSFIYGGAGNDIISCIGTFSASCNALAYTNFLDWTDVLGEAGNDIISIDSVVCPWDTQIHGGTGYNIMYTKGTSASCNNMTLHAGTTGSSLMIFGGDRKGTCTITAAGSNNILLLKSGTTTDAGCNISGFARTLTY
ncbi:MAG TPA: hypothetical protein V6C52_07155 [Coleofasciculaceae cyanobacterium]